jgi:PAS domain S-box-containing protein
LRARELESIFAVSPDAILLVGGDGRILRANPQACATFGYEESELVGQSVEALVPAADRERHKRAREAFARAPHARLMGGAPGPLVGLHKDGAEIPLDILLAPVSSRDGALTLVFARDIRDRESAQAAIRARDCALAAAQAMALVGQLASSVAHDFNNLLVVVETYAGVVAKDGASSARSREGAVEILRAASQAKRLTRQLLSVGREDPADPRPTDLNALVLETTPILRAFAGSRVTIDVCLEPEAPAALVDGDRLTASTLLNLVGNARDAMPNGGTIKIATGAHLELEDAGELPAGGYATMSVSDTGTGIDPSHVPLVFEPFFTTKGRRGGSGLGLASARAFVRQSGGDIRVRSALGVGTTFTVLLPRASAGGRVET